ncbi:MAG: Crp/Fnr family transcriptional regulator [Tyzzerella sp.]|uniref:Crp/Fnr family transcriptional regulator n=1 Tax=Candidatus Fimicola merdigallinarum TaxID=2840819 RepID=A0A9D9H1H8_9FIRM|nr:Crp/Fnr family transcriptional regulator [Candidatus Fimicola merdigallinarum]
MIDLDKLATYPLFNNIKKEDLKNVLGCSYIAYKTFSKGDYLAMTDDEIHYIGIICKGSVQMIKEDYWGNKTILLHMHTGEVFGETFVCSASFLSQVSFITTEKTEIMFLDYYKVMHTCSSSCPHHNKLISNMLRCIGEKNIKLMEKVEVVSKKTLRDKIMTYLAIEAKNQGNNEFTIQFSRIELSEYLCADRSAVTRELASMRDDGLIEFEKNLFKIL